MTDAEYIKLLERRIHNQRARLRQLEAAREWKNGAVDRRLKRIWQDKAMELSVRLRAAEDRKKQESNQ